MFRIEPFVFFESHTIILPISANKTLQLWNPANCLNYTPCRFPFVAGRSVLAGVSAAIPEACRDEQRWGSCFSKTPRADALPLELQRFSFINQPTDPPQHNSNLPLRALHQGQHFSPSSDSPGSFWICVDPMNHLPSLKKRLFRPGRCINWALCKRS